MPVSTNTNTNTSASPSAAPAGARFVLYALQGRVYASNVKHKLVDLGRLAQEGEDGTYAYLLDGDKATGSGFAGAREALAHIAQTTSFLFLDGQFTALEDLGGAYRPDLADAPQLEVSLDPLGRGAPVIHAPA
jgi:hypothetical protein